MARQVVSKARTTKVLMITDTVEFSGAEEANLNLASLLSRQESVEVALCSTRFRDSKVPRLPFESSMYLHENKPAKVEELYRSLANPSTLLRMVQHCEQVAEDFQPDIIHSGIFLSIIPSFIVSRRLKVPLVAHIHDYRLLSMTDMPFLNGSPFMPSYTNELRNYLQLVGLSKAFFGVGLRRSLRFLYNRCDLIIAVSNFVKKTMSGFLKPPIRVLYNAGFDLPQGKSNEEKSPRPSVLFCGRLSEAKGFPIFLDAAGLILRKIDAEVHIAGSGELQPYASRFVERHQKEAQFHGFLRSAGLYDLISRSHLTLHPSLSPEPCPLSVIKSVNFGTTAMASNRGGLSELLPPKYLFEPTAIDVASQAMRFLERPEEYPPVLAVDVDGNSIAKHLLSIYESVINGRHETPAKIAA